MRSPADIRVLVACEESQRVCLAFRERGFTAFSCDIQPCSGGYPEFHYQEDCMNVLAEAQPFDLLIAHPPCTFLSYAEMASWNKPGRWRERLRAIQFFMAFADNDTPHIAIENPRGIMTQFYRKPDQTIPPYYFGEREMKRTDLWLKNLPKLEYTLEETLFFEKTATEKPEPIYVDRGGHNRYFTDKKGGGYAKERSKTFHSIANAMAEQWGVFLLTEKP